MAYSFFRTSFPRWRRIQCRALSRTRTCSRAKGEVAVWLPVRFQLLEFFDNGELLQGIQARWAAAALVARQDKWSSHMEYREIQSKCFKKKIHIYEQCNEMQSCLILNFSHHKLESVINQYLFITFSSLKRSKCLYFCQKKTLINTRLTCSYSLLG